MVATREYTTDELVALLPIPDAGVNKYTRGKLTVVAGSTRYPGAACLVALASQRMGAGYTEVVTAASAVDLVRSCHPSLVVGSRGDWQVTDLAPDRPDKPVAYLVGSGFEGESTESQRLVHTVLKNAQAPVLVDGGGLAALVSKKGQRLLKRRFIQGWSTVVTPHGGEAASLARAFDLPTEKPDDLARLLALAYGVVVVLKGPDTYLSDGDLTVAMREGTAALAKAGTGDVLAGMIGALLAQGLEPLDAAMLGAVVHARAGRIASGALTSISVTAEDVIDRIPSAIVGFISET